MTNIKALLLLNSEDIRVKYDDSNERFNKKIMNSNLNKELKEAIELSIKDFKATLFIEELILNEISNNYEIENIELNLEEQ